VNAFADTVIAKAQRCYELDLIDERTLEYVTDRAMREPGFKAIIELPFDWDIEAAERLARDARRSARRADRRGRIRRLLGRRL
jgi:hypothetical protein